jgi:hypothetical protein
MTPTIRTLLTSFLIAAVAPVGLAVLDLETPAFAKNGGGNGGGHGGGSGHGGDHGNSGNSHGNSGNHAGTADDSDTTADADEPTDEDDGLKPNQLGKLNGVLHASPNAIAHASVNSPIGTARAFGEALGGLLGQTPTTEDTTTGEDTTEDDVTIDDLGAMMAKMTNKPVTAAQVEAVAEKVGIETEEEAATGDETTQDTTTDETADDQTGDEGTAPKLDEATAQAIADSANAIHDGTVEGDDTADDGDTADAGDDADAGETGDDTVSD